MDGYRVTQDFVLSLPLYAVDSNAQSRWSPLRDFLGLSRFLRWVALVGVESSDAPEGMADRFKLAKGI
jgi:hypothetical protein